VLFLRVTNFVGIRSRPPFPPLSETAPPVRPASLGSLSVLVVREDLRFRRAPL